MAASLARDSKSAPTKPWVMEAIFSKSTSSAKGIPRVWISNIAFRAFLSGMPISISRSNLPGLLNAGSITSGMLEAPMTTIWPRGCNPSMRANNWATTLFSTCFSPPSSSLLGAMASSSSRKMIAGAWAWASSKMLLRWASLSP